MKATIAGFGKALSLYANQLKYSNNKLHTSSYGILPFSLSFLVLGPTCHIIIAFN
jgi:hypothetical protein